MDKSLGGHRTLPRPVGHETQRAAPFAKPVPTAARQCGVETPSLAAPWGKAGPVQPVPKRGEFEAETYQGLGRRILFLARTALYLLIANPGAKARMS